jgi:lysyl-tRNA synthetase class 2
VFAFREGEKEDRPRVPSFMPSSVIRAFDYDPAARRLAVTFVSGRRYAYFGVPQDVVGGFGRAFSKGEYFNAAIRDHYPCERLR